MSGEPPPEVVDLLERASLAFNARDVDVDWPNALENMRLHSREPVWEYWTRQFASTGPQLEVQSISADQDGRVVVDVRQVVRALDGKLHDERRGQT